MRADVDRQRQAGCRTGFGRRAAGQEHDGVQVLGPPRQHDGPATRLRRHGSAFARWCRGRRTGPAGRPGSATLYSSPGIGRRRRASPEPNTPPPRRGPRTGRTERAARKEEIVRPQAPWRTERDRRPSGRRGRSPRGPAGCAPDDRTSSPRRPPAAARRPGRAPRFDRWRSPWDRPRHRPPVGAPADRSGRGPRFAWGHCTWPFAGRRGGGSLRYASSPSPPPSPSGRGSRSTLSRRGRG